MVLVMALDHVPDIDRARLIFESKGLPTSGYAQGTAGNHSNINRLSFEQHDPTVVGLRISGYKDNLNRIIHVRCLRVYWGGGQDQQGYEQHRSDQRVGASSFHNKS